VEGCGGGGLRVGIRGRRGLVSARGGRCPSFGPAELDADVAPVDDVPACSAPALFLSCSVPTAHRLAAADQRQCVD